MAKTPKGRASTNSQKPYDDDKNKGRRTGRTVKEGHRDSDGFEDFEDMLRQNDLTPRSSKKGPQTPKRARTPEFLDNDESVDMSIDQDLTPSIPTYVPPTTKRALPSSTLHLGSISRRVETSRMTDFDAIPSPAKTSSMSRSSHSRSVLADLSTSRNKPNSRPRPIPVYNSRVRSPTGSPDLMGGVATDDEIPFPSPTKTSSHRPTTTSSHRKRKSTPDEDENSPPNSQNSPHSVRSRKSTGLNRKSHASAPVESESDEDAPITAPHRATNSRLNSTTSRKSQAAPRDESEEMLDPIRAQSEDDSGPDDDFGGPYDHDSGPGGEDDVPVSMDISFGGHNSDQPIDPEVEEPMDIESLVDDDEPALQEDDNSEEEERVAQQAKDAAVKKSKKKKSKERSRSVLSPVAEEDEEVDMEEEISAGLQALDDDEDDDVPPEKEVQRRPKKARAVKLTKTKAATKRARSVSVIPEGYVTMGEVGNEDDPAEGVRRSTRHRHAPLEYWRGERVILGRSEEGPALCPVFKGFLEIPKEEPQPLGVKHRKARRASRARSNSSKPRSKRGGSAAPEIAMDEFGKPISPEDGMDDDTTIEGEVFDFVTQLPATRRLVFTSKQVEPSAAGHGSFAYKKLFGDDDFIASGMLTFPVGGMKPTKGTKDNTYVFFVHAGAVEVQIHNEVVTVATGGTFIVPRGNQYEIRNIANRETTLFFAQARKTPVEEESEDGGESSVPPSVVTVTGKRSSTARSIGTSRSPAASHHQRPNLQRRSYDSPHRASVSVSPVKTKRSSAMAR